MLLTSGNRLWAFSRLSSILAHDRCDVRQCRASSILILQWFWIPLFPNCSLDFRMRYMARENISTRCLMPTLRLQLDAESRHTRGRQVYKRQGILTLKVVFSLSLWKKTGASRFANVSTLFAHPLVRGATIQPAAESLPILDPCAAFRRKWTPACPPRRVIPITLSQRIMNTIILALDNCRSLP